MQLERTIICLDKERCVNQQCKNLHPNDPAFNYKIIMEKAKHQMKCHNGQNCEDKNVCLNIHDGEILPIMCQKINCDKMDCIFTHEDYKFQIHENAIEEANNLKNRGNQLFQQNQYYQAIDSFTQAIQLNKQSIYYSNRALCYKKLKEWINAYQDAQKALTIDSQNLRAQYLITISNIEILKTQKRIDTIDILRKSYTELEKIEQEAQKVKNISLQNLSSDKYKIQQLIDIYSKFQLEYTLLNIVERSLRSRDEKELLSKVLWQKIDFTKKNPHKPEYLICPLTLVDFEDPIITAFGQTYEKTALFQHFKQNGQFDPITRNQITKICIPNIQLAQALQYFKNDKNTLSIEDIEFD